MCVLDCNITWSAAATALLYERIHTNMYTGNTSHPAIDTTTCGQGHWIYIEYTRIYCICLYICMRVAMILCIYLNNLYELICNY